MYWHLCKLWQQSADLLHLPKLSGFREACWVSAFKQSLETQSALLYCCHQLPVTYRSGACCCSWTIHIQPKNKCCFQFEEPGMTTQLCNKVVSSLVGEAMNWVACIGKVLACRASCLEWCVCSNVYVTCQIFKLQFLLESAKIDCCMSKMCQPAKMEIFRFLHVYFL